MANIYQMGTAPERLKFNSKKATDYRLLFLAGIIEVGCCGYFST